MDKKAIIIGQIEQLAKDRAKRKKQDYMKVIWPLLEEIHEGLGVYIPLPRTKEEIMDAETECFDKVWYNRHQVYKQKMVDGIVPRCDPKVWETAKKAAKRIEKTYKNDPLSWTDFEWGMLNGKFSALRWVMGDEWDFLDT